MLKKMTRDAVIFAMANPTPEIMGEGAVPHVRIMITSRSDYPNQINNVLALPGVFPDALDDTAINDEMKRAAKAARTTGVARRESKG